SELLEEAVDYDVGIRPVGVWNTAFAEPNFADDRVIFARHTLQRREQVGMRAIKIGQIENADAAVKRRLQKLGELFLAHARLVRLAVSSMDARSDAHARPFH